jgi:cytoskeletal protein CcmA (bactofilin family)
MSMAKFSSGGGDAERPSSRSSSKEPGLSIVASGMQITGELNTNGVVKVEGKICGSVRAERQVLVAKGGEVEGDIYTREAVIGGLVRGAILADERVEVQVGSVVNGDITTQRILVHEGGEVNGNVRMEDPKALNRKREDSEGVRNAVGEPIASTPHAVAEDQGHPARSARSF